MQSKNAIGNLKNRYLAVLKKCNLMNVFGSLAVVGMLTAGSVGTAQAFTPTLDSLDIADMKEIFQNTSAPDLNQDGTISTAEEDAWQDYINAWTYDPSSSYTVTNITNTTPAENEYFTTFTTQEKNASGEYEEFTYGIKLKGSDYNGTDNTTTFSTLNELIIDYVTKQTSTIEDTTAGTYYSEVEQLSVDPIEDDPDTVDINEQNYTVKIKDPTDSTKYLYFAVNNASDELITTTNNKKTSPSGDINENFIGNSATENGGAIYNNNTSTIGTITGDFIGNSATESGGAIYNHYYSTISTITGDFIGNSATESGGAIYNDHSTINTITGDFIGNSSSDDGGAILNVTNSTISTITGDFIGNSAGYAGGAILNDSSSTIGTLTGDFIGNSATKNGGAIYNDHSTINTLTGDFIGNSATENGGAIYNTTIGKIGTITGDFIGNSASSGGAIYNTFFDNITSTISTISTITGDFIGNSATNQGGAISNIGTITTLTGDFIGNSAGYGGAISNTVGTIATLTGDFIGNSAGYGGAINNNATITTLTGDFIENSARYGGAIWTNNSLTFKADATSQIISGNFTSSDGGTTKDYNALYINASGQSLDFNLANNGSYTLNDNVKTNGTDTYTVNITGSGTGTNEFNLNNALNNASDIKVDNATLNFGSVTHDKEYSGSIGNATLTVAGESILNNAIITNTTTIENSAIATFMGNTSLGIVTNSGTTTALNAVTFTNGYDSTGTLNVGDDSTAGTVTIADSTSMNIVANGTLNIVNGTVDVSNGTLTVDSGATFATGSDGVLKAKAEDFATFTYNSGFLTGNDLLLGDVRKQLTNAGQLILTGLSGSMNYDDYDNLLDTTNGLITGGTLQLEGVTIDTTDTYLKDIISGTSLPNNVVLGSSSSVNDGGNFDAGKTAILGGVNGNVDNMGTLTLTGEANNVLVQGEVTNAFNGILNLYNGTITGGITTNAIVNIMGNTTVVGDVENPGTIVNNNTLTVNGTTHFNGGTLRTTNANFGNGIQDASASFLHNLPKGIDGHIITEQNSYIVLGGDSASNGRAYAQKAFDESGHAWGTGVTAALFLTNPQTLASDASIMIDGSTSGISSATSNSAVFTANSLFVVDGNSIGTNAALTANAGTLTVADSAKLHITGASSGSEIKIVEGFTGAGSSIAAGAWDEDNLTTSSALQVAQVADFDTTTGSYSVKISANSAEDLLKSFPLMQLPTANLMAELAKVADVNSPQDSIALLSRAMDDSFLGRSNSKLATSTMEGLFQLGAISGTASTGYQLINGFGSILQARANSASSTQEIYSESLSDYQNNGLSAGSEENSINNGFAVWATPLYSHTNVSGRNYGAFESGYSSDLAGITLGSDYTFNNQYRLGLAMNVGAGSSTSSGDFNKTTNDFDFLGVSLYGSMFLNDFTITADMGYTAVNNDVKNEIPTQLQMADIKSDIDSQIFTIGVTGEYTFETQHVDITPHAGIRYTNIHTDNYNTTSNGGIITQTASDNQGIVSIPVGVTFSKDIVTESGWAITPKADIGVVASFGDMEATSRTSIPSVIGTATYKTDNIDSFAFKGGVGVEVAKENLSFGLNYDLQASKHETSHGVNVGFTYKF